MVNNLGVVELFKSYQGEGIHVGVPMVFLRFAGCNLVCAYCDEDYTKTSSESPAELCLKVIEMADKGVRTQWVSITGGEPLLQNGDALVELMCLLIKKGKRILVETNATMPEKLAFILSQLKSRGVDVSNSLFMSIDIKPDSWKAKKQRAFIKIVGENDIPSVFKLVSDHKTIEDGTISLYLSAVLSDYCKDITVILTPKTVNNIVTSFSCEDIDELIKMLSPGLPKTTQFRFVPQMHVLMGLI